MRVLESCLRSLRRLEELWLASAVLAIAALNLINVGSRALLGISLASVEELSRFSMIGITFVGLGHAAGRGRHIRMTALYDALAEPLRRRALLLSLGVTSALCFYLCALSLRYVFGTVRVLGAVSPVLEVPKWLVYLVVPLGFLLSGLQYALACVRTWITRERYIAFDELERYAEAAQDVSQP